MKCGEWPNENKVSVLGTAWLGVMFQEVVRRESIRQGGGGSINNLLLLLTINMHANARLTNARLSEPA